MKDRVDLRQPASSPICPLGSRRTGLSPTWSGPEGSSHNDFVPGRRLPPPEMPSTAQRLQSNREQCAEPLRGGQPAAKLTGLTARIYSAPAQRRPFVEEKVDPGSSPG